MLKIVINKEFKADLADFIINLPHTFHAIGTTVYEGRNIIKTCLEAGYNLNIKYFKKPHIINQLVYATFRLSKARRSYEYALKLIENEIDTPTPVAYLEHKKRFLFKQSAYISIHENVDGTLQEFRQGHLENREELVKQFAAFTAHLHKKKILHLDYSSGNILYKKAGDKYIFYLVDLNRMIFNKTISINTASENFRRLWGSDEMIALFVKEYAKHRHFDYETTLQKVMKYRKRFWNYYSNKYPGQKPYYQ